MTKKSTWDVYLEENGISGQVRIDAVCYAKPYATEKISEFLLGEVNSRKNRLTQGETQLVGSGKAIPDSYVNKLAFAMLSACSEKKKVYSETLCELIRVQLRVPEFEFPLHNSGPWGISVMLVAENLNVSNRKVAQHAGVDHTTIRRWRADPQFSRGVEIVGQNSNLSDMLNIILHGREDAPTD